MSATLLQVAIGGAIGASLRYLTGVATLRAFGPGFPWGTLVVNILGSMAMGALVVILAQKGGTRFAPFVMTGILGGFTTFSAFSLEAALMIERRELATAFVYAVGSVVISIAALFVGLMIARKLFTGVGA